MSTLVLLPFSLLVSISVSPPATSGLSADFKDGSHFITICISRTCVYNLYYTYICTSHTIEYIFTYYNITFYNHVFTFVCVQKCLFCTIQFAL
jgi:hypothetical protein